MEVHIVESYAEHRQHAARSVNGLDAYAALFAHGREVGINPVLHVVSNVVVIVEGPGQIAYGGPQRGKVQRGESVGEIYRGTEAVSGLAFEVFLPQESGGALQTHIAGEIHVGIFVEVARLIAHVQGIVQQLAAFLQVGRQGVEQHRPRVEAQQPGVGAE